MTRHEMVEALSQQFATVAADPESQKAFDWSLAIMTDAEVEQDYLDMRSNLQEWVRSLEVNVKDAYKPAELTQSIDETVEALKKLGINVED